MLEEREAGIMPIGLMLVTSENNSEGGWTSHDGDGWRLSFCLLRAKMGDGERCNQSRDDPSLTDGKPRCIGLHYCCRAG